MGLPDQSSRASPQLRVPIVHQSAIEEKSAVFPQVKCYRDDIIPSKENVTEGAMSIEDRMTVDERRKYLRKMQKRYRKADRKERGRLLDEMAIVTELHRKSLIRLMKGSLARQPRGRQRSRSYGPEVEDALRVIVESTDYICAERLTPNLVWLAKHLAAHGELTISPQLEEQLSRISVSTVERILTRLRQDEPRLPRRGPKRTNNLLRDVPMKRIPWQEQEPGHFEVDLVHHCGPSASGEYVHTANHRCGHSLERTSGGLGTQLSRYERRIPSHSSSFALLGAGVSS
jgi:hypothetical protein